MMDQQTNTKRVYEYSTNGIRLQSTAPCDKLIKWKYVRNMKCLWAQTFRKRCGKSHSHNKHEEEDGKKEDGKRCRTESGLTRKLKESLVYSVLGNDTSKTMHPYVIF